MGTAPARAAAAVRVIIIVRMVGGWQWLTSSHSPGAEPVGLGGRPCPSARQAGCDSLQLRATGRGPKAD